jgi:hypothetical protein
LECGSKCGFIDISSLWASFVVVVVNVKFPMAQREKEYSFVAYTASLVLDLDYLS